MKKVKTDVLTKLIVVYSALLLFGVIFIGPFIYGLSSSFKDNADEWPPKISIPQFTLKNWVGSYTLAKEGCNSGLFGEFLPGKEVTLNIDYNYPKNFEITPPTVTVTDRKIDLEKNQTPIGNVQVKGIKETDKVLQSNGSSDVNYSITFVNTSDKKISILPVDIEVPNKQITFLGATRDPNRVERRGKIRGWDNLVSGTIPYIFSQYSRVFNEQYSPSTGKPLFLMWIKNSFMYSFIKIITTIIFATMAGYVLSRLNFRGKKLIFTLLLFSMMIPSQVTFISNYLVLRDGIFGFTKLFGVDTLLNTYTGLVLSGLVVAGSVFIMKQFFDSLGEELEEAARIDGANTYQIYFHIMLPLAKPAIGAISILSFQGAWNDFFAPMVYITSPIERFPLTIGLKSFQNTYAAGAVDWGPILAGSVISAIPVIILFLFFQKYFMQGISFGGGKE